MDDHCPNFLSHLNPKLRAIQNLSALLAKEKQEDPVYSENLRLPTRSKVGAGAAVEPVVQPAVANVKWR